MDRLKIINDNDMEQVVNVSSVPQRSPFRYPGGKTWLIPKVRRWLCSFRNKPRLLIEPFAGGGIVGLSTAFEGLAERVLMVELDEEVAAVWQTILSGEAEWLAKKITSFEMSYDNLKVELSKEGKSIKDLAFKTLLRNRTAHGGIMASGAGLIKNGENGKGILSRWYPNTLSKRIRDIDSIKNRIDFIRGNGIEVIDENKGNADTVFFIDPPYTAAGKKAGKRLYKYNELDHESLFTLVESIKGEFLLTYDCTEEIISMASKRGFQFEKIAMSNTHHSKMNELIISKTLDWLR